MLNSAGTRDGQEQEEEHKDMPRQPLISRHARTHTTQTRTWNTTSRLGIRKRIHPPQPPIRQATRLKGMSDPEQRSLSTYQLST